MVDTKICLVMDQLSLQKEKDLKIIPQSCLVKLAMKIIIMDFQDESGDY
jgi:hypothetical protein